MTHYLGIIAAYGSVAIMAWLAALLYPRLIPAAAQFPVGKRWRQAGLFLLATAASFALAASVRRGLLPVGTSVTAKLLVQIITAAPFLAFIAMQRCRAVIMVPRKNILRSLAIGVVIAVLAIAAFCLSTDRWGDLGLVAGTLVSMEAVTIVLRTLLRCLVVAAFLSVVVGGWSIRVALALAAVAISATQIPALLDEGFTLGWAAMLVIHVALVTGLLSAINVTRNIVWFWPVFFALNVLQFATA